MAIFDIDVSKNKYPPVHCKHCGAIMGEGKVMSEFPGLICPCGAWQTDNRKFESGKPKTYLENLRSFKKWR